MTRYQESVETKLLDNARTTYDNAKSSWAKNYWESVYRYLLRKYKREN